MPRIATKPSGLADDQQRDDDADQAQRDDAQHQEQAAEALQLHHQERSASGAASPAPRRRPRPANWRSPRPCRRRRCGSRSAGLRCSFSISGASACDGGRRRDPGATSACTVRVGTRSRRQISGYSCSKSNVAIWLSGTVRPFGSGICRARSVDSEHALLVECPRDDVDEIDVVAHLRDGVPGHTVFIASASVLRAQAEQPGLVLVDADADLCAPAPSSRS